MSTTAGPTLGIDARLSEAPIGLGLSSLDGRLLAANQALANILGFDEPEAIVGLSLSRFHAFPELAADMVRERLEEAGARHLELDLRRADGTEVIVSVNGTLRSLETQSEAVVVFSAEDVTRDREHRENSTQGHKMEAVVRFAGGVAHDYGNLLTSIIGEAQHLLADLEPGGEAAASATQILDSARRAGEITTRLLMFSRSDVSRQAVVDVRGAIGEMHPHLEQCVGPDTDVLLRLEGELGAVRIDPSHLEQILANLVENARDAMPGGGRIVIEASRIAAPADTDGLDFTPLVPAGHYVSIAVGDTGIGMNAETRRRIFDPFYTTKSLERGAGLGLTTVYGHMLRANGHIAVLSAPAHGTLVRLLLPPVAIGVGLVKERARRERTERTRPGVIVVVDDEAPVLRVMGKILKRAGYEVLEAPDGPEARRLIDRLEEPPDLLITDVMMPRMKGTELAAWVRGRWPGTPALLVSGYTDNEIVRPWVDADPDVFLTKPFEPEDFLARVERRISLG